MGDRNLGRTNAFFVRWIPVCGLYIENACE